MFDCAIPQWHVYVKARDLFCLFTYFLSADKRKNKRKKSADSIHVQLLESERLEPLRYNDRCPRILYNVRLVMVIGLSGVQFRE